MKKGKINNNKNNKIISSILVVAMCCQSLVVANPNSDNSGFVPYEGIDNNLAADGFEEKEKEDIKSKENNSSGLIRKSLDVILFLATAGSLWL